jgi:cAMP-dependent protein kinase regulator
LADQSRPHSAPRLKLSLAANGTNPDPPFQASTDPASSMSLDSLPLSYQNEVSALNREILKAQPTDILQFCANFFNRRLEAQRAEFLLGQGGGSKSGGSKMAETAFPGTNPFGNGNQFGSTSRGVSSIEEEEENDPVASPTDSKFKGAKSGAADSSGSPFTNASPFGAAAAGGAFGSSWSPGQSDANGNMPDEGASGPPSSFRPMSNDSLPANYAVGRRTSVSAESMTPDADSSNWRPPVHTKTAEQVARLRTAVSGNFLFSHLDDDSFSAVLGALVEKPIPAANIKVITQGDPGDYFYVIEKGDFDIYIHSSGSLQPGSDGMGQKVASIGPGGSFGELALMYNAPRAATVVSVDKESTLWQLDRVTFRKILMDSAYSKRTMYEKFLEEVPLLSSLKTYERAKIADALESHKFPAGTQIIREGDAGDAFYLLEAGEAEAYKRGTDKPVKEYQRGDFFGELALLDDKPRQATIVAKTEVKVAKLGRDGFKRLLGPVEGIMRREEYDDNAGMDPLSKYKTVT